MNRISKTLVYLGFSGIALYLIYKFNFDTEFIESFKH